MRFGEGPQRGGLVGLPFWLAGEIVAAYRVRPALVRDRAGGRARASARLGNTGTLSHV